MSDVSELFKLAADLRAGTARVGLQAAGLLRKTARDVEGTAKQIAPVDTGFLRNSIFTTFSGDGRSGSMRATVGPAAHYGAFVEFGTSRMSPQPYMGPALSRHAGGFMAAVRSLGGDIL